MKGVDVADSLLASAYHHRRTPKWTGRYLELLIGLSCVNSLILYRMAKGDYEKKGKRFTMNSLKDDLQRQFFALAREKRLAEKVRLLLCITRCT